MATHDGHRDRLRAKIEADGLKRLEDHEVLEYFLFAFVPRRNTNDIAHRLLERFGSLSGVCDANVDELAAVQGMTRNAALFLAQLPAFAARYKADKAQRTCLATYDDWATYLCELIGGAPTEHLVALCLDVKGNLIKTIEFTTNQANAVSVDARQIVKDVVVSHAVNVILGHNHPSQDARPSYDDLRFCGQMRVAFTAVGIVMVDCLVVTQQQALSILNLSDLASVNTAVAETHAAIDVDQDFVASEEEELEWLIKGTR